MHAHNPPDTLFLAAVRSSYSEEIRFDQHDLCPELYRPL
jgi:hypothetical protein